ncbi:MAG: serine/threonine protein kinase [Lachnospiraceae bacterium]|nr:serine/threonine protein kinase [Lachnospiraceae bacterium]
MEFGCLFDGKYKIIRLIGSGGCGRVYLAENVRTKSLWAIKEIPYDGSNLKQVECEIEVLKNIRHHALPRVVDVLREDRMIYLIEDYFEGKNVDEILHEVTHVGADVAGRWALEICEIMIFLHGQAPEPIIYRDLKPSNIILSPEGSIRLVDFGSVRHYKANSPSDTVYIGTRGYAAPEQYGLGQTSKQTDVYSFGVTMQQILTGKRPTQQATDGWRGAFYAGAGGSSSRSDIGGGDAQIGVDANTAVPIPRRFRDILSRCVEMDPAVRYPDFAAIKADLLGMNATGTAPHHVEQKATHHVEQNTMHHAEQTAPHIMVKEAPLPMAHKTPHTVTMHPTGVYRCATISVIQNHEFAFEFACRASEQYGLRVIVIDCDFESTLSEWYFTANGQGNGGLLNNSLYHALKTIEQAASDDSDSESGSENGGESGGESGGKSGGKSGSGTQGFGKCTPCRTESLALMGGAGMRGEVFAGLDSLPGLVRGHTGRSGPVWLNEPDPEYSGPAADFLVRDRALALRRLLAEITIFADICLILTGRSVLCELNMRCFQNSHYIVCPGGAEAPSIRAFKNTAILAERRRGVPSDRFKYVFWDYSHSAAKSEAVWELSEQSLAGVVRKSRRRDESRRDGVYTKCYAYSMERAVKKDYDDIIKTLGLAE